MTRTPSWLLIGAGQIARKRVASALQRPPLCRLDAVCSRSLESAARLAAEFGAPKSFDDPARALVESDADAVYIATPVDTHMPLAMMALDAGKHVLVEKPFALTASEGRQVATHAGKQGRIAACAYYRRCSGRYRHLREVLDREDLGTILSVHLRYASWYAPEGESWRVQPEKSGGGPIADMGSHMFDLVIGLFGDPRLGHAAVRRRVHSYPAEDSASVIAELPNGASLLADFHWCSRTWVHRLEILGSQGRLCCEPFDSGPVVVISRSERTEIDIPGADNAHAPLVEDFVLSMHGERLPACIAEDAVRTDAFLDEIRIAASGTKEAVA